MFDGQIQPQAVPAIQARLRLLQLLRSPGALSGHRLKMEVPTIYKAYGRDIPTKYGLRRQVIDIKLAD